MNKRSQREIEEILDFSYPFGFTKFFLSSQNKNDLSLKLLLLQSLAVTDQQKIFDLQERVIHLENQILVKDGNLNVLSSE